jgi:hypothetical protein
MSGPWRPQAGAGPLERRVCARHGHELMGWKSPVGVTDLSHWTRITTSRRQGQAREGLSEGSRSAKMRADGQKLHRRPSLRASQHMMTKPNGNGGQGKCSGCASNVHVLTRGDLCGMAVLYRSGNSQRGPLAYQGPGAAGGCRPHASEPDNENDRAHSARASNRRRHRTEVSKGRISRSGCRR